MSRSTVPRKRPAEEQEAAWIADEDRFALQQAKKKAALRIKGGRARPIDVLAVALVVMDPERNVSGFEEEMEDLDDLPVDPEGVFEGLDGDSLLELEEGIDGYAALERSGKNVEYWNTMKAIAQDRRKQLSSQQSARGVSSVSADLDKLLGPKNLAELEKLEKQIKAKLSSNQPIDTDYWQHLLTTLYTYKAKAKLRKVARAIADSRLEGLRKQQGAEADAWKSRLEARFATATDAGVGSAKHDDGGESTDRDPEPMLRLSKDDKALRSISEADYADEITAARQKVLRQGYVGTLKRHSRSDALEPSSKRRRTEADSATSVPSNGVSHYDREVARGLGDNEEIFAAEEPVTTKNLSSWSSKYRARKPQYFNRVLMGYEWNKYNQTHYDADNPPPRVVQGYKFNVFYPDLVDVTKAPTYRIEREGGRRKGETWAAAGEQDTCVIRFTAGPPYEDVAFRIVDREWDFSAKRERGFKSSFDKGILQLHFQFKKIYYRK